MCGTLFLDSTINVRHILSSATSRSGSPPIRATTDERRPAYAQVADDLRRRIVAGALAVGDRLPSEDALADEFAVSRSTVREALRVLASQHLVTTTRGVTGGTFVALPDREQVADLLELNVGQLTLAHEITVDQLLVVREALEVPAASLAAERVAAGTDGVPELHASDDQTFETNRSFHRDLLVASGNPLLEIVTRPVFSVLERRWLREHAPTTFWTRVHDDHAAIADAVRAGDPDAAAAAMRSHLADLRTTYLDLEEQR